MLESHFPSKGRIQWRLNGSLGTYFLIHPVLKIFFACLKGFSNLDGRGMNALWQVLTCLMMTAVMVASETKGERGHPLAELGAPPPNQWLRRERQSGEWRTRLSSVLKQFYLLLLPSACCRHLKNNLMHECSLSPSYSFPYCYRILFFPPLPHRSIHGCVEKKQGVEDGKKAKGSQEI